MAKKKEKIHLDVLMVRARILLGRFDRRLAFAEGERKEELEKARTELDATLTEAETRAEYTSVDLILQIGGGLLCWGCSALSITKFNPSMNWLFWSLMGIGAAVFSLSIYCVYRRRSTVGRKLRDACRGVGDVIQPEPETDPDEISLTGPPMEIPTAWKVFADRSFLAPGLKFKKQLANARILLAELLALDDATHNSARKTVEAQEDLRDLLQQMERGRRFTPQEMGGMIAGIVFFLQGVILVSLFSSSAHQNIRLLAPMVVSAGSGAFAGSLASAFERRKRLLVLLREGCGDAVRVLLKERGEPG